eukprot:720433-Alexandrium_andersonii.AAC.1
MASGQVVMRTRPSDSTTAVACPAGRPARASSGAGEGCPPRNAGASDPRSVRGGARYRAALRVA